MKYHVRIVASAEREMNRLPSSIHSRIAERILSLEDSPRPAGSRKLGARDEYRIRIGQYRVLYTVDDRGSVVTIVAVGHRKEVYR